MFPGMLPGETYPEYVRRMYYENQQAQQEAQQQQRQQMQQRMTLGDVANDNQMNSMRNEMTLGDMRARGRQPIGSITQGHRRALGSY